MLLSRGATIFKSVRNLNLKNQNVISIRKSHGDNWCYRSIPPPRKSMVICAELLGGLMWWWVLWNFWHHPEEIFGHYPYPRPVEWSDEELGVPPDDS